MRIQETLDIDQKTSEKGFEEIISAGSRFKRLGEEFFGLNIEDDLNLEKFLKQLSKYNLYSLPVDLNEFFINYHHPQFSFLKEYYLVNELVKKSNERRNLTFSSKQLEEFYVKWAVSKNSEGRIYYAKSLISKMKDDHSKVLNMIILALIFTNENSLLNYESATNLLERAENFYNRGNSSAIRNRILYLINILNGFSYLKNSNPDEAFKKFQNAIQFNKWSANAKFYLALSEIGIGNDESAISYLNDVVQYDEIRLNFAITSNNYLLFKYFIENSFIENVFRFSEFSSLYDYFVHLANEKITLGTASLKEIINKSEGLGNKKINSYLHETNRKDLVFISKLLKDYKESKHYYVQTSLLMLEKKLNNIIESIIKNIKEHYNDRLKQHIYLYEEKLTSENAKIADLENSIKEAHKKIEIDYQKRKELIENELSRRLRDLEFRLEELEKSKNNASIHAFTNSMFYNTFISIFVALTGGFAEFTNTNTGDVSDFSSIFSFIILRGLKWGLLSFIIGLIVSGMNSITTVINIYSKKQRLSKSINDSNSYRERVLELLKNEEKEAKEKVSKNTRILINNHKKNIERLSLEKKTKLKEIEEEVNKKIEEESKPFTDLMM